MAPASAPAHNRRARSFMVAFSRRHLSRTVRSAPIPEVDHARPSAVDPRRSISSATRSTPAFAGPYLRDTAEQAGLATRGILVEDLGWVPAAGALVDLDGAPIAVLFKLYPWE